MTAFYFRNTTGTSSQWDSEAEEEEEEEEEETDSLVTPKKTAYQKMLDEEDDISDEIRYGYTSIHVVGLRA
jgi:hypothetical protein